MTECRLQDQLDPNRMESWLKTIRAVIGQYMQPVRSTNEEMHHEGALVVLRLVAGCTAPRQPCNHERVLKLVGSINDVKH